jgi:hypothetical protein
MKNPTMSGSIAAELLRRDIHAGGPELRGGKPPS